MKSFLRALPRALSIGIVIAFLGLSGPPLQAQDWIKTGSNLSNQRIRLGVAEFRPLGADAAGPGFKLTFDATLFSDLTNAGIFDMVSRSLSPTGTPGSPQEVNLGQWATETANASMVAFGSINTSGGRLTVSGWVFDAKNPGSPQVLGKQYSNTATDDNARMLAHQFADDIINRLGGGINGIAETKIYFVSSRTGTKEIWAMDYDGANQHLMTKLGSVSLSPRISPDNSRLAFSSIGRDGWAIRMFSLDLGRLVAFPAGAAGGANVSPAWSGDGTKLAFSSARSGESEIWVCDANGGGLRKLTAFRNNSSPTWNPRTNNQIAWVSGRTGEPQIYIMDSDGGNITRMTDGGYAVSPSWSPNGQLLAFSWNRKYGPGAPGGQDIYVLEIASMKWLQLTHDSGSNDFPSWSPDGRHLVFERAVGGHPQIWSMLADGTEQHELTYNGSNFMPNWSWK